MNQLLLALAFTCAAVGCENRSATLPTDPKKIVVSDDPARGQFRSINEAVKAAAPGATILIRPGVYQESVVIDKPVELMADGGTDGGDVAIEVFNQSCITMSAERAKVSGLKLRSVSGTFGTIVKFFLPVVAPAVHVPRGDLILENCDIYADTTAGVLTRDEGRVVIRGSRLHDGSDANGVWARDGGQAHVEDCEIFRTSWAGVRAERGGEVRLRRTKVHDARNAGAVFTDGGKGSIEDCEFFRNAYSGVESRRGASAEIVRTRIYANLQNGLFTQQFSGPTTIRRSEIFDNCLNGVYVKDSDPVVEDCHLYRNRGAGVEISGKSNPAVRRSKIHESGASGVLVVEGGAGVIDDCDIYSQAAYQGVSVRGPSGIVVRRSKIHDGRYQGVIFYERGTGTVEDCEFWGNDPAGIVLTDASVATIRRSVFHHMSKTGVIVARQSVATIKGCEFNDNPEWGIMIAEGGEGKINNVRMARNAGGAIRLWGNSKASLADSDAVKENEVKADPGSRIDFVKAQ